MDDLARLVARIFYYSAKKDNAHTAEDLARLPAGSREVVELLTSRVNNDGLAALALELDNHVASRNGLNTGKGSENEVYSPRKYATLGSALSPFYVGLPDSSNIKKELERILRGEPSFENYLVSLRPFATAKNILFYIRIEQLEKFRDDFWEFLQKERDDLAKLLTHPSQIPVVSDGYVNITHIISERIKDADEGYRLTDHVAEIAHTDSRYKSLLHRMYTADKKSVLLFVHNEKAPQVRALLNDIVSGRYKKMQDSWNGHETTLAAPAIIAAAAGPTLPHVNSKPVREYMTTRQASESLRLPEYWVNYLVEAGVLKEENGSGITTKSIESFQRDMDSLVFVDHNVHMLARNVERRDAIMAALAAYQSDARLVPLEIQSLGTAENPVYVMPLRKIDRLNALFGLS